MTVRTALIIAAGYAAAVALVVLPVCRALAHSYDGEDEQ